MFNRTLKLCKLIMGRRSFNVLDFRQHVNTSPVFILKQKTFSTFSDSVYNDVDYDAITKGDSDLLKKLKVIMLEVEVLKQDGGKVPQTMTTENWSELLNAKSRNQRQKSLKFWWLKEMKKKSDKEKKEKKRLKREESLKEKSLEVNNHIEYGLNGSTIFLRIYDTTIDRCRNWKLMEAMMFNQSLVIDCGYENNMNNVEISNCTKQLMIMFAENRLHKDPFNMHFCNVNMNGKLIKKLEKMIPSLFFPDFPLNITEKSYLDVFQKDQLVYLTPHCKEDLINYNDDDIYIIGAIVDKEKSEPLSLAKAKAEGLRMAKFPLDRYLDWNLGTKNLTINQSLNIMLDLKVTGDWDTALAHVPRRKIRESSDDSNCWDIEKKQYTKYKPQYARHKMTQRS